MYFYKIFIDREDYQVDAIVLSHKIKFNKKEFDDMVTLASKPIHYMDTDFVSKSLITNYGFTLIKIECESDLNSR